MPIKSQSNRQAESRRSAPPRHHTQSGRNTRADGDVISVTEKEAGGLMRSALPHIHYPWIPLISPVVHQLIGGADEEATLYQGGRRADATESKPEARAPSLPPVIITRVSAVDLQGNDSQR